MKRKFFFNSIPSMDVAQVCYNCITSLQLIRLLGCFCVIKTSSPPFVVLNQQGHLTNNHLSSNQRTSPLSNKRRSRPMVLKLEPDLVITRRLSADVKQVTNCPSHCDEQQVDVNISFNFILICKRLVLIPARWMVLLTQLVGHLTMKHSGSSFWLPPCCTNNDGGVG